MVSTTCPDRHVRRSYSLSSLSSVRCRYLPRATVGVDADQMVHAQINFYEVIDADTGPGMLPIAAEGDEDVLLQPLRPSSGDW